jgi:hypothetical protein
MASEFLHGRLGKMIPARHNLDMGAEEEFQKTVWKRGWLTARRRSGWG